MVFTANRRDRRAKARTQVKSGGAASGPAGQLQTALRLHMAGDVAGAVGLYQTILAADPHQADALHLLGVACLQSGRPGDAVDLISRAIGENPSVADYHGNLAGALLRLDRNEAAAEAAQRAIALNGGNAGFHCNLAVAMKRLGRPLDAADAFRQALAIDPTTVQLHKEIGDLCSEGKSYALAIEHYRAYLAQAPDHPDLHLVWNNLGYALEKRGELEEAEVLYRKALAAQPDDPDYVNNVGLASRMLGKLDEAEVMLRRAVAMAPGQLKYIRNLSGLLGEFGRFAEAEALLKEQVERFPNDVDLRIALGDLYKQAGYVLESRNAFVRALELDAENAEAWQELGVTYVNSDQMQAAYDTFKKVLEINPRHIQAHLLMLEALQNLKRPDEANIRGHAVTLLPDYQPGNVGYPMKAFRNTCDFDAIDGLGDILGTLQKVPPAMLPMAFLHLLVLADTPENTRRLVGLHRRWGDWLIRKAERNPLPALPRKQPAGKIRLGFLSSDLNSHSVAKCLMPFLEDYDRERFQVFCYSPKNIAGDPVQEQIVGLVDEFRFLVNRPDIEFAEAIRGDGVDILIELNGVTQASRTPVVAYRPAPVQISYLGYPFTYGVRELDYMLLDRYLAPEAEGLLVERPLVMPGAWVCFTDMGQADVDPVPPCEKNGYVTFGTLNNPYKFTREAVATWAAAMHEVPDSRFLLVRWYDGSTLRCHHLAEEFGKHGISGDRLLFMRNERGQHLPCYNEIDLSLDTFPLTGGTTTCDALWMGVPVVTLRGPSYHQRISHSILNHAGLGDLSCATTDEFVRTAIALANDVARRRQLRANLRGMLLASDLFRRDRFVPAFQDTMMSLVERHGLR